MNIYIRNLLLFLFCFGSQPLSAQPTQNNPKMDWFSDARLGIFIHWGIYAVNGVSESWSFHNKQIPYVVYMKQINGFTASKFNSDKWTELIFNSGARYCVITTKHHDGVALWDTKMNNLSIPKKSPAKRDVITPLVKSLRNANIRVGTYFSLIDWSCPDYPGFLKDSSRYAAQKDTNRWKKYLHFCHGQIEEIMSQFSPDLMWFDGDWEHSANEWKAEEIRNNILEKNPYTVINGRLSGFGDYATPEQNFPVTRPDLKYWELCMTTNDSWGYFPKDTNYKTPFEVISVFADVISMGGNLLLDIGPKEDGTIVPQQENLLKELGKWTNKHTEAIFGTVAGMSPGHFYGPSTMSKDSMILFLFVPAKVNGDIMIKGLSNQIKTITVVGNGEQLIPKIVGKISWSHVPGLVYINIPLNVQDEYMTVLKIELDKPVNLYNGKGGL